MSIRKINLKDSEYPENLKNIYKPPSEIYIRGSILPQDKNAIAIVGTRRATYYGLEQCRKLSYDLALRGITIVSGMARGIDTAAHKGALQAGGRTIAVLGSGHDHVYPPENKNLYDKIVESGAVISEFKSDTRPFKANFPRRNRIISGLAIGVVVVEAPERSGALITANFALEQGREVFAMPGNINSAKSSGTNKLIKEGAKLIEGIEDIFDELGNAFDTKKIDEHKSPKPADLSSAEKMIYDTLEDDPKSIDEISEILHLSTQEASLVLLKLELKKLIKTLPGNNFIKV